MFNFISYGNHKYKRAVIRIKSEARSFGIFDTIKIFENHNDIYSKEFYIKYNHILDNCKGNGFWIWKPILIKKELDRINNGDYLIYCDAGCVLNKNGLDRFNEYINLLDNSKCPILSFQMNHIEKEWTTKEIFKYFNVHDNTDIINTGQLVGGIFIIKKNNKTTEIINKWYNVTQSHIELFTDNYNDHQNSYFKDNRHDQSIFSVIRKLYLNHQCIIPDETYFDDFNSKEALKIPFLAKRKH